MCHVRPAELAFQAVMGGLPLLRFDLMVLGLAVYFFWAVIWGLRAVISYVIEFMAGCPCRA